jgi:hypothetical protein
MTAHTNKILRLESYVLLLVVVLSYYMLNGNWLVFALVLFAFDISMAGYLVNDKLGRITYNLGHSFVFPGLLILIGWSNDNLWAVYIALIWLAHISLDRTLGYGLKQKDFHHTHLGKIGR